LDGVSLFSIVHSLAILFRYYFWDEEMSSRHEEQDDDWEDHFEIWVWVETDYA